MLTGSKLTSLVCVLFGPHTVEDPVWCTTVQQLSVNRWGPCMCMYRGVLSLILSVGSPVWWSSRWRRDHTRYLHQWVACSLGPVLGQVLSLVYLCDHISALLVAAMLTPEVNSFPCGHKWHLLGDGPCYKTVWQWHKWGRVMKSLSDPVMSYIQKVNIFLFYIILS